MDHRLGRMFCLMVFSLLTTAVFAQQEFSADLVDNSEKASSTQSKIYAGKDKLRFEGQQNGRAGTMIINFAAQTTDILIPERKCTSSPRRATVPLANARSTFFGRRTRKMPARNGGRQRLSPAEAAARLETRL